MKAEDIPRVVVTAALAVAVGAGVASAKLPPLDDAAKAKAAEAAAKNAEAAKKAAAELAKAQDRAVENYKRGKGGSVAVSAPAQKKK
ncbi:MAG: hypothetical protein IT529_07840 [Burkholderiales bacterium]|nr:hypothetical protein [Burkholderiales bacterium]